MNETNATEEALLNWDVYINHRDKLDQLRVSQLTAFDASIITLSSGALGLSVILLTAFAAIVKPVGLGWLFASWAIFVATIVMNLISYVTGAKAAENEIVALDSEMRKESKKSKNLWAGATRLLNGSVIVLFPFGAAFLLAFSALNAVAVEPKSSATSAPLPSAGLPQDSTELPAVITVEGGPDNVDMLVKTPADDDVKSAAPTGITPGSPPVAPPKPVVPSLPAPSVQQQQK
jgi:hypothetical protein